MNFCHRALPGVLALATLIGLTGCGPNIPETVRIGVPVTLSGPNASRGQDLLNGAALAAEELNNANFKIRGRPVKFEIVPKDDKGEAETAFCAVVRHSIHPERSGLSSFHRLSLQAMYASEMLLPVNSPPAVCLIMPSQTSYSGLGLLWRL